MSFAATTAPSSSALSRGKGHPRHGHQRHKRPPRRRVQDGAQQRQHGQGRHAHAEVAHQDQDQQVARFLRDVAGAAAGVVVDGVVARLEPLNFTLETSGG